MNEQYDVIIVGARVAGSATAMLLARRGYKVLAVDRAAYGTDVRSTHALMKGGVLQLERWGLLDEIIDAGTPKLTHTLMRTGDERVTIPFKPHEPRYAPRRTVLDPAIADAAFDSGANLWFRTTVTGVAVDDDFRVIGIDGRDVDGERFSARAPITIGADGISSLVARFVHAPAYHVAQNKGAIVYTYVDDPGVSAYEWFYTEGLTAGVIPTSGGSLVWVGMPPQRFEAEARHDPQGAWSRMLADVAPDVHERIMAANRTARFFLHAGERGFYRKASGPGWALVGDAGHFTDPLSAHGLTDALRDAELVANACEDTLSGRASERDAFRYYEAERNRLSMPIFEAVDKIASYDWTMPQVREHLLELSHSMKAEHEAILGFDRIAGAA